MQIDLKSDQNLNQIQAIKDQIGQPDDLHKFNTFLGQYGTIYFQDPTLPEAARFSCGGTICCPEPIIICFPAE